MFKQKTTVFCCRYCGRRYIVASTCSHHEKVCKNNPSNWHPCLFCKHLESQTLEVSELRNPPNIKTFFCKNLKIYLMTNKAVVNKHPLTKETDPVHYKMPERCSECTNNEEFREETRSRFKRVENIFQKRLKTEVE